MTIDFLMKICQNSTRIAIRSLCVHIKVLNWNYSKYNISKQKKLFIPFCRIGSCPYLTKSANWGGGGGTVGAYSYIRILTSSEYYISGL